MPISVEVFAGLVWLCLDLQGPSLQTWLGAMTPLLSRQGMARMPLTSHVLVELACHWRGHTMPTTLQKYQTHTLRHAPLRR